MWMVTSLRGEHPRRPARRGRRDTACPGAGARSCDDVVVDVAFGECELSTDRMELRRAGVLVAVEPQVFEVLAYLVGRRERMVPKNELLDEIWGDRFVSESALTSRIKTARQAIGDTGRDQRMIKTIHGRGYRFVAEVAAPPPGQRAQPSPSRRLGRTSSPPSWAPWPPGGASPSR
jgi:DNA-binding winged helix-turn-helix (wHTH) protein